MASKHRVLVADDQLLVRVGILALLREIGGYDCLEPVEDGASCIRLCESDPPDLLLLDINMPGANGLEVTQAVLARHPQVRIVVLTGHASAELAGQALEAGARGFVSKDFVLDELALALRMVMAGRPYMSPDIAMQAMVPARVGLSTTRDAMGEEAPRRALTPRQRDVLRCISQGLSNKEIARSLDLSLKTVEYHRAELIQRLDLHDVASLTRYALSQGLAG